LIAKFAVGVLSSGEDEQPLPPVGSPDLRRAYKRPLRIEPERGKVGEDGVESQSKVPCDVLKDRDSGSKYAKGVCDVRPDVPLIFGSFPEASCAEGLAGVAAADDVHGAVLVDHGLPVGRGEVAQVRRGWPVVGEDLVCAGVNVGHPGGRAAEHALHGHVEAAVAGAPGADARAGGDVDAELSGHGRRGGLVELLAGGVEPLGRRHAAACCSAVARSAARAIR
jgi:hypothetical protein